MSTLENIILFTLLGSVGSLIGGILLLSRQKLAIKISHFLASFAAGILLGTAFFDLLPEALHAGEEKGIDIFFWTLFGIIIFFLLERGIHWFHHHEEYHKDERVSKSSLPLIIIGDTMHNFIDGVVIAATFMINAPLGIVTALAVFAHEIPQEIGDFGLMLHKGMERKNIILVNVVSAIVSLAAALVTFSLGNVVENYLPILISITAGFFIYIALSDLVPEIHHEKRKGFAVIESFLLVFGIIVIYVSALVLGH